MEDVLWGGAIKIGAGIETLTGNAVPDGEVGRGWVLGALIRFVNDFDLYPKSKGIRKPSKCFEHKGSIIRIEFTLTVQLKSDFFPSPTVNSLIYLTVTSHLISETTS